MSQDFANINPNIWKEDEDGFGLNSDGQPPQSFLIDENGPPLSLKDYLGVPAPTLRCKICGSTEFTVGSGSYFTAIKCPKCEWELCIHDG